MLFSLLSPEDAADMIEDIPDAQAADLVEDMPSAQAAAILEELSSDHLVDVLGEMDEQTSHAILAENGQGRRQRSQNAVGIRSKLRRRADDFRVSGL